MSTRRIKVYGAGKISIPAAFRNALHLADGDSVIAELKGDSLILRSANAGIREAQRRLRELNPERRSLVDELIAERREEAGRE